MSGSVESRGCKPCTRGRFEGGACVAWVNLFGLVPPALGPSALALFNNKLTGTIPPFLSALKSLEALELSFNQIGGDLSALPKLTALTYVAWCALG